GGAVSARREAGRACKAACFTVARAEHYPERYVPAGGEIPGEPWALVELAAARRAIGARASFGDAAARAHGPNAESDHARGSAIDADVARSSDRVPIGVAYFDAGVPYRFADRGEALAVA